MIGQDGNVIAVGFQLLNESNSVLLLITYYASVAIIALNRASHGTLSRCFSQNTHLPARTIRHNAPTLGKEIISNPTLP